MFSIFNKIFQPAQTNTIDTNNDKQTNSNITKINNAAVPTLEANKETDCLTGIFTSVANFFKYPVYPGLGKEKTAESIQKNTEALKTFGVKDFFIVSTDGAKIHCLHANGKKFQETIKNTAGESAEITLPSGEKIAAIAIPRKNAAQVLQSLSRLKEKTPYATFIHEEKTFLLSESHLEKLKQQKLVNEANKGADDLNYTSKPYQPTPPKSAVMLCGGIESQAACFSSVTEMFTYLMEGYEHVLAFDYRGSGTSSGVISEAGIDEDLKQMHHYLQHHGVKNKDLLIQGTCFGAGPAARFAKNNPDVNLRLYSPYDNSKHLAKEMVANNSGGTLSAKLQTAYVDFVGCEYDVQKDLQEFIAQEKGHLSYVGNRTDELISKEHDLKNLRPLQLESILGTHKAKRNGVVAHVSNVEGIQHGAAWYSKAVNNSKQFVPVCKVHGLKEKEVSFGDYDQAQGWMELSKETFVNNGMQDFIDFNEEAGLGAPLLPASQKSTNNTMKESAHRAHELHLQAMADSFSKMPPNLGNLSVQNISATGA